MVTKPTKEDMIQVIFDAESELLAELDRNILEAEIMDSSVQDTLKRIRAEVLAIYAPLRKQLDLCE